MWGDHPINCVIGQYTGLDEELNEKTPCSGGEAEEEEVDGFEFHDHGGEESRGVVGKEKGTGEPRALVQHEHVGGPRRIGILWCHNLVYLALRNII